MARYLVGTVEDSVAKNGKSFLKVQLTDSNKAKSTVYVWENMDDFKTCYANHKVMEIRTDNDPSFPKVVTFSGAGNDTLPFIKCAFPSDEYAMQLLDKLINSIKNPILCSLNKAIFTDEVKEKFIRASAAHGIHHAYYGGLLKHTFELMQFISAICSSPLGEGINKDIAMEGALLHDIGKLADYTTADNVNFDYTTDFYLSSHLSRGPEMIAQVFPTSYAEVQHVMHIIRSHHLQEAWGAITSPKTPEAVLVFLADYYSATTDKVSGLEAEPSGIIKIPGSRDIFLDFERAFGPYTSSTAQSE